MAIKLKSGFEIIRYSDLNYEEMTVEVQYEGEQIAQVNMDKGLNNLEIEIFTGFTSPDVNLKFLLNDFLEAISEAKNTLKQYKI